MYKIDLEELANFYNNSLDSILEIFEEFLTGYDNIKNDLETSYQYNNAEMFKGHLHHHAPMFSYIGLSDITNYYQDIERKCLTFASLQEMESEFKEILRLLENAKSEVVENKEIILQTVNN